MRLISIVMGARSTKSRTGATQALLRYGFRFFKTRRLYSGGELVTTVPVWKGSTDMLDVGVEEDIYITVPAGQQNAISADMQVNTLIMAPVAERDAYGKVRINLDDKTLFERPVIALHSVPEGSMWKRAFDAIRLYFY